MKLETVCHEDRDAVYLQRYITFGILLLNVT